MERQFHFISGLPCSGSPLFSAILSQNARFRAGMCSALHGEMSGRNEFSVFINDAQRRRVLRALFDSWYADCPAEIIACVRQVPWIVDCIERLVQQNAFSPSSIFNYTPDDTVNTRANGIAGTDEMLRYAYDALKGACYGTNTERLLQARYEILMTEPANATAAIYDFLSEPAFSTTSSTSTTKPCIQRQGRHARAARRVPHRSDHRTAHLAAAGPVPALCQRRLLARSHAPPAMVRLV